MFHEPGHSVTEGNQSATVTVGGDGRVPAPKPAAQAAGNASAPSSSTAMVPAARGAGDSDSLQGMSKASLEKQVLATRAHVAELRARLAAMEDTQRSTLDTVATLADKAPPSPETARLREYVRTRAQEIDTLAVQDPPTARSRGPPSPLRSMDTQQQQQQQRRVPVPDMGAGAVGYDYAMPGRTSPGQTSRGAYRMGLIAPHSAAAAYNPAAPQSTVSYDRYADARRVAPVYSGAQGSRQSIFAAAAAAAAMRRRAQAAHFASGASNGFVAAAYGYSPSSSPEHMMPPPPGGLYSQQGGGAPAGPGGYSSVPSFARGPTQQPLYTPPVQPSFSYGSPGQNLYGQGQGGNVPPPGAGFGGPPPSSYSANPAGAYYSFPSSQHGTPQSQQQRQQQPAQKQPPQPVSSAGSSPGKLAPPASRRGYDYYSARARQASTAAGKGAGMPHGMSAAVHPSYGQQESKQAEGGASQYHSAGVPAISPVRAQTPSSAYYAAPGGRRQPTAHYGAKYYQ